MVVLLLLVAPAASQQFVHLDGQVNNPANPVTLALGAGCWRITPVAGVYTAFHAWNGNNSGCDPSGLGCSQGWATVFWVGSIAGGSFFGGYGFTSTPALALANSTSSTYWLPQAATVNFAVGDNNVNDNLGGISLQIDPIVGCAGPAAMATYGTGTSGVAGIPNLAGSAMPQLGNLAFQYDLDSAAPSSAMGWLIGWGQGSVPLPQFGATVLVQPFAYSIIGVTDGSGTSALPVPLECNPALLCGLRITCQAVVLDAAATGGVSFSNGVDLTIGS